MRDLHGTHTCQRARAKTARVVIPPSNFTPRTCPHSACLCTRNGALLPPPPTASARMHVLAHMTTPYSRIFSSQWLWNRAFSPLLSLSSRASPLPRNCGRTRTATALPKPLVEFRSVPRACPIDTGMELERGTSIPSGGNDRTATNCILPYICGRPRFSWKKDWNFLFLITNDV